MMPHERKAGIRKDLQYATVRKTDCGLVRVAHRVPAPQRMAPSSGGCPRRMGIRSHSLECMGCHDQVHKLACSPSLFDNASPDWRLAISEQTQSCEHHTALSGVYLVVPALVPFYLFDIYDRYLPQALSFLSTVQRPLFSAEKDYFHPGSLFTLTAATFCHGLHAYGGLASCA